MASPIPEPRKRPAIWDCSSAAKVIPQVHATRSRRLCASMRRRWDQQRRKRSLMSLNLPGCRLPARPKRFGSERRGVRTQKWRLEPWRSWDNCGSRRAIRRAQLNSTVERWSERKWPAGGTVREWRCA